jgi:Xaa-Pro aminopeptidase
MNIPEAELSGRVEALRQKMRDADLDALIVFSDEYRSGHSTYLTDYKPINVIEESPQVVVLVGDAPPVVLLGRLNTYAAIEKSWLDDFRPVHRAPEIMRELCRPMADRKSRIGLIGKNLLPVALFESFRDAAPKAQFVGADALILSFARSRAKRSWCSWSVRPRSTTRC